MTSTAPQTTDIIYPDSDGQPMADNTKQFRWIVIIKENLELLFAGDPNIFIAGDLLWYPVKGDNKIRQAPDALVAFGRPKGDRGSYRQWEEADIAPQVVFEILSPGNRLSEMIRKFKFYDRYGVEEYYVYDPDDIELAGWRRQEDELIAIDPMDGWVSPRLQVRFVMGAELELYRPDGRKFLTSLELEQQAEQARQQAEQARQQAKQARQQAEEERQRAESAEALLAQYRDRFGDL